MSKSTSRLTTTVGNAVADELAAEHARLDVAFADLCERARSGDWCECDAIWDDFSRDLEVHMRLEEESFFPDYAHEGPEAARIVEELCLEHDALRARLLQLGVDIQLHLVRAERIERFVDQLRAHARREDETLHLWLAGHR